LADFKKDLKKRDQENFKNTTLDELKHCIGDLQQKQHSSRRLQNLNRLKPFIEAMEQYGKVVTVFANTNEIIAYVWVCDKSKYSEWKLMSLGTDEIFVTGIAREPQDLLVFIRKSRLQIPMLRRSLSSLIHMSI